jgi:hypothetical protein
LLVAADVDVVHFHWTYRLTPIGVSHDPAKPMQDSERRSVVVDVQAFLRVRALIPLWESTIRQAAWNQIGRGVRVSAKIVPVVTEVSQRQVWQSRPSPFASLPCRRS